MSGGRKNKFQWCNYFSGRKITLKGREALWMKVEIHLNFGKRFCTLIVILRGKNWEEKFQCSGKFCKMHAIGFVKSSFDDFPLLPTLNTTIRTRFRRTGVRTIWSFHISNHLVSITNDPQNKFVNQLAENSFQALFERFHLNFFFQIKVE